MLLLILGFIITTFSAAISLIEKRKKRSEPEYNAKKNKIAVLFLIIAISGAIISLSTGIDALNQKAFSADESTRRQARIDSQSQRIYELQALNTSLLNTDVAYSKRLDSSSSLNYSLTKELSDYASGKGSFCYFKLGIREPNTEDYHYALYSNGKNPMDNVVARIVDVFELNKSSGGYVGNILTLGKVYPRSDAIRMFQTTYTPSNKDTILINIFFQTGNRDFTEELKSVRVKGTWATAINVYEGNKKLFVSVDKNFPKAFLSKNYYP